jgi:hypothetical protein
MKTTRLLGVVAIASALVSVGCFAGAYSQATANDSGSNDVVTREIPWDGSASLSLGVESDLRYVQSEGPAMLIARGPHRSVSTLVISGGHVHDRLLHTGARLELTLHAPAVSDFRLDGRSSLVIERFGSQALTIRAEGRASVEASGRAESVTLDLQGYSTANLARLDTAALGGTVAGHAKLVAAPRAASRIEVRGSGSVVLLTQPKEVANTLHEAGKVIDASR